MTINQDGGRKLTKLALALVAASSASAASAGWQATQWNMTPEEVAGAMTGKAPLSKGSGGDRLGGKRIANVGEYAGDAARFRTVYYYDADGLAHVALKKKSGKCEDIYRSLVVLHGQPLRVSDQLILKLVIWHDRPARNRIRLLVSKSICDLNYERLEDYEAVDLAAAKRS